MRVFPESLRKFPPKTPLNNCRSTGCPWPGDCIPPGVPTGLIFNVQRFSVHDGPGVRSTVFLKGCPLRCAWCHNPESQGVEPTFIRLRGRCMACGRCPDDERADPVVHGRDATDVACCPTGALQQVGETVTVDGLVARLLADRLFFDESGGGVTFSGGEPLRQAAFVAACCDRLRAEGVSTALDTCGYAPWTDLAHVAARADVILYDVKLMDPARHHDATGVPNARILDNLRALAAIHPRIWVRLPVIPGLNDDDANLDATAAFIAALPRVERVDLLPYHATAEPKFARVGLPYPLAGTRPPTPDALTRHAARFRVHGVTAFTGASA